MAGTFTDVTDNNFQAEVIESETPVLVDFWAPWCAPCRVVAPVLEEIAAERDDLRVVKLNIDENQQTTAQFDVLSIPTMILFRNGAPVRKVIGAYPKKKLEAQLFED
jgi:thioredoxin 1